MNSKMFFILLLLVSGLAVFGLTTKQKGEVTVSSNKAQAQVNADTSSTYQSQSKAMGAVDVEVTPILIEPGEKTIFKLILNTHSVELDQDFTQIAKLTDDQGNDYQAVEWTGGSGGHHLTGNLVFEPIVDSLQEFTIIIDGIDNDQGIFVWKLK